MKPIQYPLLTVVVIALAIYVAYRNWGWWGNDKPEMWAGLVLGSLMTVVAWMLAMGLGMGIESVIESNSGWEWQQCWKAKMVTLRGSDGVSGRVSGGLFMLSGNIGSEQFYHYYTTNKDGAFAPHKWKADSRTRVYEEDRSDGEVIQWDKHFKNPLAYWFANPDSDLAMDFHIPKGSLKQQFNLE